MSETSSFQFAPKLLYHPVEDLPRILGISEKTVSRLLGREDVVLNVTHELDFVGGKRVSHENLLAYFESKRVRGDVPGEAEPKAKKKRGKANS